MNSKKIAVYGAGGCGREVAWLAQSIQDDQKQFEVVCFIDDNPDLWGKFLNDIRIISFDDAKKEFSNTNIVGAIGAPKIREITIRKAESVGFGFERLIHPRAEMSKWIEIGEGTVICAGNILTTNIVLGRHVQINLNCTVGHDVIMEEYATLAPGVHVSGCVHIGKRAYIGTGAVIINGTQNDPVVIGADAVISAGSFVTRSIPPGETWCGVPARILHR